MGAEVMEEKSSATHLRIRIKPLTKKTVAAAEPVAERTAAAESSTCPECGKSFPSDKALFGHLRCHPERDYRGAAPPPTEKDNKAAAATPPPRAPVKRPTDKRRRKELDEAAAAAAAILTYIAAGKKLPRSDFDELDEYVTSISSCRRSKKARVEDLATASLEFASSSSVAAKDRSRRYVCTICFKSFSSHQALGGHRASHNKTEKINNSASNGKEAENDAAAAAAAATAAVTEHRCKSCNLSFSSGQALGGHQRRHFHEAAAQQATHRAATSQPCDRSASRGAPSPAEVAHDAAPGRPGRSEIDLNQMPCFESEEN